MSFSATNIAALTVLLGALFGLPFLFALYDDTPLLFESLESKTENFAPVYNEIRWISEGGKDIWMMNQSHDGPLSQAPDRLAIVVDKRARAAKFFQLTQGPLHWEKSPQPIDYKVSCFMCHSNGLRAIRPRTTSATAPLTLFDRVKSGGLESKDKILWSAERHFYTQSQAPAPLWGQRQCRPRGRNLYPLPPKKLVFSPGES